jgi:hypothetical protein
MLPRCKRLHESTAGPRFAASCFLCSLALRSLSRRQAGALVLVRSLATVLFEVRPHDPGVFAAAAGVLLATGVLACTVPALRAVRIDPISIRRAE